MRQFSDANRRKALFGCGVDVEESYKQLQLEIRMGGPVCQRIEMAMMGLHYENNDRPEGRNITDHHGSMTDGQPASEPSYGRNDLPLTRGELRALNAVAGCGQIRGAAKMMGLSNYTVIDQVESARRKLGAKNTTHAVAIAIRKGLIR